MSPTDQPPDSSDARAARPGAPVKRRLAAILATDAVGYSRMMAEDEEGTIRTLAAHRAVIDGIIQFHDGRIVGTAGDSVIAEFASPVEAVRCAIEIQDALKTRNDSFPEDKRLLFRIGINLGDVMVKGEDLLGDGVNVAARLESLAEPGGILVSSSVYDQITGKLSLSFTDMGEQALKNIPRPVRAFRVAPGTGAGPTMTKARKKGGLSAGAIAAILGAIVVLAGVGGYVGGVFDIARSGGSPGKPSEGEVSFWESVRNSSDPAELEAYIAKYPQGAFVTLARTRLDAIAQQRAEETRKAEEAKKKAEAEAEKAKAEAEAAKKQAEADKAAAAKAKAEAAAAQAKQDAAKKAEAETAQVKADAAKKAEATRAPAAQSASVAPASARFDGAWSAVQHCEQFEDNPPFTAQLRPAQIRNGQVTIERGQPGNPGWFTVSGTIASDGTLALSGSGISGLKNYAGREYAIVIRGAFHETSYEGTGIFGRRNCSILLTRKEG
ncbi:MAG: adenylate/guanylate cyclase domain-containing protein [Alphaproteobacteria bacterium]